MSNQNEHKPGYKHTPLGWIPEEWEVKSLEDVVEFLDGQRKPIKETDRSNIRGIYPYYGASGIIDYVNDYIFDDELILLGEDGANILNRSTPLAFRVKGKIWVNNHAHVLKPKNGAVIGYLTEFLESIRYERYNTGTAQPKLNKEVCSQIPVLSPTEKEQRKIAAILSTWDEAITKTQQLIAQLQQRNKGLMQQLLTGKKRLKGGKGEWKKVGFEQCFEMLRSYAVSRDGLSVENDPEKNYCIHYGDIHATYKTIFLDFDKELTIPQIADESFKINDGDFLKDGDIIIADASEDYEGVGEAVEVKNIRNKKAVGGLHTIVIREKKGLIAKNFLAFLFANETLKNTLRRKATGTSVYSVSRTTIKSLDFEIPSLEEQVCIADFLSGTVNEVQLYEQRLTALQQQKKGLMQKLLTGEVRVKG